MERRAPLIIAMTLLAIFLVTAVLSAQQTAPQKPSEQIKKAPAAAPQPADSKAADTKAADLMKAQAKAAIPADSSTYVIGPEDVLLIYVWKEEQLTRTVPVRMDGMISLPLVDDIKAAGITPLQLKQQLVTNFQQYVDTPDVTVVVMEANSYKVFLQGEVKRPGVFRLRSETSFLQLIVMAEGFTDWANKKKITIIRKENGKDNRMNVNYNKIIDGEEQDVMLKSGDIVVVR